MRLFLFICLAILLSKTSSYAQTNPVLEQQARAAIQARGLEESEVRARLLQEGIDIDNIKQDQLVALQPTIERILDEMEAEKKKMAIQELPLLILPDSLLYRLRLPIP